MRRGYNGVECSIGRSYDEIDGVTMTMSENFNMLSDITTWKKVKELDCLIIAECRRLSIAEVVNMVVEVASNDEFMRGGGCKGKKR